MKPRALRTDELDYHLPAHLIAMRPAEPRDSSRLLVMWRSNDRIEHRQVRDLPEYLHAGDALVFNNTAVVPARLVGHRADTGGKVEGLYLHDEETSKSPNVQMAKDAEWPGDLAWHVMLKAGGKLQARHRIELSDQNGVPSGITLELVRKAGAEWIVRVHSGGAMRSTHTVLRQVGRTPLPPYILHARAQRSAADEQSSGTTVPAVSDEQDRQWYQTIYAAADRAQSVAAPTAGLHFTLDLLRGLKTTGVERIEVTLHVGPGTFKPVTAETLDQHEMHSEWYEVSAAAVTAIHRLRLRAPTGARLIAVGTTAVRTLESLPYPLPDPERQMYGPITGMTDLMIAPPYDFRFVDGLLTNFHLPRSTLLALVAAMVGLDRLKAVYQEAINRGYRFYSYGDAMLILP